MFFFQIQTLKKYKMPLPIYISYAPKLKRLQLSKSLENASYSQINELKVRKREWKLIEGRRNHRRKLKRNLEIKSIFSLLNGPFCICNSSLFISDEEALLRLKLPTRTSSTSLSRCPSCNFSALATHRSNTLCQAKSSSTWYKVA